MKVTFLKKHTGNKPGVTAEVKDSIGKYLVKMGVAKSGLKLAPKTWKPASEAILGTPGPDITKVPTPKKKRTKKEK